MEKYKMFQTTNQNLYIFVEVERVEQQRCRH